jgi:hypothetical protein
LEDKTLLRGACGAEAGTEKQRRLDSVREGLMRIDTGGMECEEAIREMRRE